MRWEVVVVCVHGLYLVLRRQHSSISAHETGMKAPTLFMTMYIHPAPQDAVLTSMRGAGQQSVSGTIGLGLSNILQAEFGEDPFKDVR